MAKHKLLIAAMALFAALAPAAQAETTIAALGDSLTQGFGLPLEQGFVPQLERWLQGQGAEVSVINAGVSGDTTAGGLSRIAWTLTPEVDALIVALGGNDLLRGIPPEASRANLAGILAEAQSRNLPTLLIGLPAPGNYGPDYKAAFDAIYPELAAEFGTQMRRNFLAAITDGTQVPTALMQADGIHPNADGVALIVQDLGPAVLTLLNAVETTN
ncbi:GDSL family lipase [Actibacterium mucosum KCTC 23349]|uniref:GDSL family lipase n=1 Tax=Actibacterium mucosum KCTC 23349 TaxID=1454373 RepID=A0A037ZHD4_9RHOB|nr:GDSL family lipase [Actibacterium mucosum KCTC 23349]